MLSMWMEPDVRPPEPAVHLIATILDRELYWDDREGCPVWVEGEPLAYTLCGDGGIIQTPLLDVDRLPSYVRQPKRLDCGHGVRGGDVYITWLAVHQTSCVACAEARSLGSVNV